MADTFLAHPTVPVRPTLILIAAVAERDRAIGFKGHVPWVIPEDSKRFQRLTIGHSVIMGRNTWELDLLCCPLVDRFNIVVTSRPERGRIEVDDANPDRSLGVVFVRSLAEAIDQVGSGRSEKREAYIIGGATLYAQSLPLVDVLDLTIVEGSHVADTYFPPYEDLLEREFVLEWHSDRDGYRFTRYRRRSTAV
jgi:dihydrofolate reductase